MRLESECRLVETGRVVGVENVVLLHRVAAVERLDELLGGHRDAHIAIAERAGGTVAAAAEGQADLAVLHGAHPRVGAVGLAAERELELLPVGLDIAGQQVEGRLRRKLQADDVRLFDIAVAQRGADDAGVGLLRDVLEVGLDVLDRVRLLVMPRGGLLIQDRAVQKLLRQLHAAVVHGAVVAGEVVGRQAERALEVRCHADELAGRGLVLAELDVGDRVELFRRLDELHSDRVLRRAKRQKNAVTELFPLFFRKFHSTHSNFCVQRARPPEGGARARRIVFELYSTCACRQARGQ